MDMNAGTNLWQMIRPGCSLTTIKVNMTPQHRLLLAGILWALGPTSSFAEGITGALQAFAPGDFAVHASCTIAAFLVGIGLHEWAHAWTANQLGDDTPAHEGRLSLNPLDHLDPIGTILLILAFISTLPIIGWGKAVNVNPDNFSNPKEDMMRVALAGPLMNFFIAATAAVGAHSLIMMVRMWPDPQSHTTVINFIQLFVCIALLNLSLGFFNLIPVPPLDGSKVLASFLPPAGAEFLRDSGGRDILILYMILRTGVLDGPFYMLDHGLLSLLSSTTLTTALFAVVTFACLLFLWQLPRPKKPA